MPLQLDFVTLDVFGELSCFSFSLDTGWRPHFFLISWFEVANSNVFCARVVRWRSPFSLSPSAQPFFCSLASLLWKCGMGVRLPIAVVLYVATFKGVGGQCL
jgi:hypothetical protein